MTTKKISSFPIAAALALSDVDIGNVGGVTKQIPYSLQLELMEANISNLGNVGGDFTGTFNGVHTGDGAGLTGIGTGTGGILNTGSTTIAADTDINSVGVVALQTRTITRLTVENNGNITAETNNFVAGTPGKGLDFDPAGGGSARKLFNDYEEDTYTVTLTPQSGSITLTASNKLSYVKKAREVTITGRVAVASVSGPSGDGRFSLPFTVASESQQETHFTGMVRTNVNYSIGTYLALYSLAGLDYFIIEEQSDNLEPVGLNSANIIADDHFTVSFTYFTDE